MGDKTILKKLNELSDSDQLLLFSELKQVLEIRKEIDLKSEQSLIRGMWVLVKDNLSDYAKDKKKFPGLGRKLN